jgi:hypothetical protein
MPRSRKISAPVNAAPLQVLRAQLAEGEYLAWAGSPEPGPLAHGRRGGGKLEAIALVGGGYVILAACVAAVYMQQWLWVCAPLALLVFAYYAARTLRERARKTIEGTVYGFTTQRALILQTYPAPTLQELPIAAIQDVTISDGRDDPADLKLQTADASASLVWRRISEPQRARAQLLRLLGDPVGTGQEIAAGEAYALQMRQAMAGSMPD